MTLKELISEVKALGFDTESGVTDAFIDALNRAMRQLFCELCITKKTVLHADADSRAGKKTKGLDIRALTGDFLAFHSLPTDRHGKIIRYAQLLDGTLYLPSDYRGEIYLVYRRLPRRIHLEDMNTELDIPEEYTHLLPLLAAYYVWLDYEPELSGEYLSRYREMLGRRKELTLERWDARYIDTNGWA